MTPSEPPVTAYDWPRFELDDETFAAVEAIEPVLRDTAAESEHDRRLSPNAVEALRAAGLFRLALPAEVGGREMRPLAEFEVYERVARIDTSACWNLFVGNFHTSLPAVYAGDEAIQAMFGAGDAIVAGQPAPLCEGRLEPGGMRVSGRHSWGSGIAHAGWVLGGCTIPASTPDGQPLRRSFAMPKADVEVVDNWHVLGVEGSGSADYVLRDVFVPDGFWWDAADPRPLRGGPRYSVPHAARATACHSGVALGTAERALELITALAAGKRRLYSTNSIASRGVFQHGLGKAYTELSAAREYTASMLRRLGDLQEARGGLTMDFRKQLAAVATYATDVSVSTAQFAYRYAGGSAPRLESPFQRAVRDLLVAQQHLIVGEHLYEELGRWLVIERAEQAQPQRA